MKGWGIPPTDYTFTAQYSNVEDFGLMFYQSRCYDPALGRFTSADTLIPGGAQGLDRFAYVNNNPVRYTDPSGHRVCDEEYGCEGETRNKKQIVVPPPPQLQSNNRACTGQNWSIVCLPQNSIDNQTGSNFGLNLHVYIGPEVRSWPPNGYYIAGYESVIEPLLVDWFHFFTNGAGVIGDGAAILALFVPPTVPVSGSVAVVGNVIDWVGVGVDVYDFMVLDDPSGVVVDGVEHFLLKVTGKSIPIFGLGLNLEGFFSSIESGRVIKPILRPYPVYTLP